jgi:hypothetical protein
VKRTTFLKLSAVGWAALRAPALARTLLITYRDRGCDCCEGWVAAARAAGYEVDLRELDHDERLRKFGLTEAMASCHTTVAAGYLVEGHAPFDVVAKLLKESPHVRGIALPGMPLGVPGMIGGRTEKIPVLTLEANPRVYALI